MLDITINWMIKPHWLHKLNLKTLWYSNQVRSSRCVCKSLNQVHYESIPLEYQINYSWMFKRPTHLMQKGVMKSKNVLAFDPSTIGRYFTPTTGAASAGCRVTIYESRWYISARRHFSAAGWWRSHSTKSSACHLHVCRRLCRIEAEFLLVL